MQLHSKQLIIPYNSPLVAFDFDIFELQKADLPDPSDDQPPAGFALEPIPTESTFSLSSQYADAGDLLNDIISGQQYAGLFITYNDFAKLYTVTILYP